MAKRKTKDKKDNPTPNMEESEKKEGFWESTALGNKIQMGLAVLTFFSLVVVFFTLLEMKVERETASRPLLVMNPIQQTIEWDSEGNYFLFNNTNNSEEKLSEADQIISDESTNKKQLIVPMRIAFAPNDSLTQYSIVNIGEGLAKDITVEWNKNNVKILNDFLTSNNNEFSDFYIDGIDCDKFNFGDTLFITNKESPSRLMYLQADLEEKYTLYLPAQYSVFAAILIKNHMVYDLSPVMYMTISFSDVQDIDYYEVIGLSITQIKYEEHVDGSGSATFQFIPELKWIKKGKYVGYNE